VYCSRIVGTAERLPADAVGSHGGVTHQLTDSLEVAGLEGIADFIDHALDLPLAGEQVDLFGDFLQRAHLGLLRKRGSCTYACPTIATRPRAGSQRWTGTSTRTSAFLAVRLG
jgi:hypothetical protein